MRIVSPVSFVTLWRWRGKDIVKSRLIGLYDKPNGWIWATYELLVRISATNLPADGADKAGEEKIRLERGGHPRVHYPPAQVYSWRVSLLWSPLVQPKDEAGDWSA